MYKRQAQHALDWLPDNEKQFITNNLMIYLYGTELPDNSGPEDGIGDTAKHHVYFNSEEFLTEDSSAVRAQEEYNEALSYLELEDYIIAAKTAGIMTHYIADLAVFGHVMGSSTDWGSEVHHSDYESYVNTRTNSYNDQFDVFLSFDGSLDEITAYEAAVDLGFDTTFDVDGDLSCVWMDENYDWSDSTFLNRCGESLNLAVNLVADVLHTLASESAPNEYDLVVSVSGLGSTIPSVGSYRYEQGSEVVVTASADSGWIFSHWLLDNEPAGSDNPITITVDADYSLVAVFEVEGVNWKLNLEAGWNMISFSSLPEDASFSSIFSDVDFYQVLTWYGSNYVTPTSAEAGVGYWVLVLEETTISIVDYNPVTSYTKSLPAGWSMIGSIYEETVEADDVFPGFYQLLTWDGSSYNLYKSASCGLEHDRINLRPNSRC